MKKKIIKYMENPSENSYGIKDFKNGWFYK